MMRFWIAKQLILATDNEHYVSKRKERVDESLKIEKKDWKIVE